MWTIHSAVGKMKLIYEKHIARHSTYNIHPRNDSKPCHHQHHFSDEDQQQSNLQFYAF